jgi:hypothetical protein
MNSVRLKQEQDVEGDLTPEGCVTKNKTRPIKKPVAFLDNTVAQESLPYPVVCYPGS